MGISVRWAQPNDLDWIVAELKKFSDFYGSHHALFGDQEYVTNTVTQLIKDHVFLIAQRGPELLGFIGGFLNPHFYNPKIRVLTGLVWWVPKEYRTTSAGADLLQAFSEWGKKCADWVTLSIPNHSHLSQESLSRFGFRFQEKTYLMEVI